MNNKIFTIGELLIDMVGVDNVGLKEGVHFEKNAGGAPANVACCSAKLGGEAYFLGQVGDDYFGEYLLETLESYNVNCSMSAKSGTTTIAFVSLDANGERNFSFVRGSDADYSFQSIDTAKFRPLDIVHFGSSTALLGGEIKKTYTNLLFFAGEKGDFISFDPNYRDSLLTKDKLARYKKDCITFVSRADFVKLSDEELFILTDTTDIKEGARILNDLGARVVCVTLGDKGTLLSIDNEQLVIPSIDIKQVDTTGAGDAFVGGVLYQLSLSEDNIKRLSFEAWTKIVEFANIVGALACTKYGALNGLPTLDEIVKYQKNK